MTTKIADPERLGPYWRELGYDLDERTGLFHMWRAKPDGGMAHDVLLDAERYHAHRKYNLAQALANPPRVAQAA